MIIDATLVNMTLDSVIMTEKLGVIITLELRTMADKLHVLHVNECFPAVATEYRKKPETLVELINLILRRQHPQVQYIAEQNGVTVVQYTERWSMSQSFSQIEYDPETKTLRL